MNGFAAINVAMGRRTFRVHRTDRCYTRDTKKNEDRAVVVRPTPEREEPPT